MLLSRNHPSDGGVALRQIEENRRNMPITFSAIRAQRLNVLRHYVNACASQYAHDKLAALGEPRR